MKLQNPIQVAVINASTVVTDAEVLQLVHALQVQVDNDFAPIWGVPAGLTFVPKGKAPPANYWWLSILDNSDAAGALGYHDITPDGKPLGKVFAGSDKQFGYNWTITASHELLEMLVDPLASICVLEQSSNTAGRLFAYEICDACESDSLGYLIKSVGLMVSDFVYPSWFESFRDPKVTKFDHRGLVTGPFVLLAGGYIGFMDVNSAAGWQQMTADLTSSGGKIPAGTRRARRMAGRARWVTSTVSCF